MSKNFNVTGVCVPEKHYMVDVSTKIKGIIDAFIDKGKYFTINRARQYGKTTTLYMLERALQKEYIVISLSFEAADDLFESRYLFAVGFVKKVAKKLKSMEVDTDVLKKWEENISKELPFEDLNDKITALCQNTKKRIVLMLDEVDKSSDNQIFLSFLGLLRTKYLDMQKGEDVSFYSVILASVYDIKNLKLKYQNGEETKYNSPWNIAADFTIDISFSAADIVTMLEDYEKEHEIGMDKNAVADELYAYTSGYPYLVSRLCQLIDDIQKKLFDYPELKEVLYAMLFKGIVYPYHANNSLVSIGEDFGFVKEVDNHVVIANRIYEIWLYNFFIAEDALNNKTYEAGLQAKNTLQISQ